MRRSRFALAFVAVTVTGIASIVACSSNDPKPGAAQNDRDGSFDDKPVTRADASADAEADGSTDASDGEASTPPVVDHCTNGLQDDQETDIDCGGTECGKCLDGKACVRDDDCFGGALGGACENNVCKTPNCTDNTANGGESDVDCGGSTCAKCTFGKHCNSATDCQSGTCDGNACSCPTGMANVTTQTAVGSFCIDSVETTKGQYQKFMDATSNTVPTQIALCAGNSFLPRSAWEPAESPPVNGLAFSKSLPVHYVDWCDAYAYCKWAGKQLCGKLGGGSLSSADGNDETKSAWYSACSKGGLYAYPYNPEYQDRCNGDGQGNPGPGPDDSWAYGYEFNHDEGLYTVVKSDANGGFNAYEHVGCYGPAKTYQMSGNVAEWEDACDDPATAATDCRVRGGSYKANNNPAALACAADRRIARVPSDDAAGAALLADVGIRCCLY